MSSTTIKCVCVSSRVNDCALLSGSACKHSIKHTHIAHIKVSPLFNLSTWHTLHAFLWKTHMYYLNVCSLSRQRIVRNLSIPITIPNMVRVCLSHSEIDKNDFLLRFVWNDTCDLPFDRIHNDHWWWTVLCWPPIRKLVYVVDYRPMWLAPFLMYIRALGLTEFSLLHVTFWLCGGLFI